MNLWHTLQRGVGLGLIFVAAAATAQNTYIWTGGNGTGTEIGAATNWGGILPDAGNYDTAEWNGLVPGNLSLVYDVSVETSGPGQGGLNLYLTGNQTGAVSIGTKASSGPYLAIYNILIDSGAGPFTLGGGSSSTILNVIARPSGAVHSLENDSAHAATLTPWIEFWAGGGADYTMEFSGTGNWQCNNYLNDGNGGSVHVQVDGPGSVIWNPSGYMGANGIASPITITGGTLALTAYHPRLSSQAITNNGTFQFNAPSQSQTLSGPISGSGILVVSNGTFTLSGQSTYTGSTVLAGGELVLNGAETVGISGPLGHGGPISFTGGTLGFGLNNAYDYSSRFSTAAGQAYNFDTGGQNVTFASGLTSSGGTLTKLGAGTLTLAGPGGYTGTTTVSAGKLVFQGAKSGSGNITVADGAALGAVAGSPINVGTLTLGISAGATLEFNNVSNPATALITAGTLAATGPVTVNINSGVVVAGQHYPLLTWGAGSPPTFNLGNLGGATGNLSTVGGTLYLYITAVDSVWTGGDGTGTELGAATNWGGTLPDVYNGGTGEWNGLVPGNLALVYNSGQLASGPGGGGLNFYLAGSQTGAVSIGTSVAESSLLAVGNITIDGGAGAFSLGGGTASTVLELVGRPAGAVHHWVNNSTNPATINPWTMFLNGGGAPFTLDFSGTGTWQCNSYFESYDAPSPNIQVDGPGTMIWNPTGWLGGSGVASPITINGGTLILAGPHPALGNQMITNSGTFEFNAPSQTQVLSGVISGPGVLKVNAGTLTLSGTNTYTGGTTIIGGTLQIGSGGAGGTVGSGNVLDNASLTFDLAGTQTVSGAISGSGTVTNSGTGTVILAGNNTFSGGTTITAGTVQLGNGGSNGTLNAFSPIVLASNATFNFDSKTPLTLSGFGAGLLGQGNVIVSAGSVFAPINGATYSGWTFIAPGATFQPSYGNQGAFYSSVVTNNGTLLFLRQDSRIFGYSNNIVGSGKVVKDNNNPNSGDVTLSGTNTYTGGTWIGGGGILLGDGVIPGAGSLVGPVIFTNTSSLYLDSRYLTFDRPDNFTFTNDIIGAVTDGSSIGNSGYVEESGPGTVALTGNNSYAGGTIIDSGTVLQVGNGGVSGSIGTGPVTDNGELDINLAGSFTFTNGISGVGSVVHSGTGVTTLNGNLLTYSGSTTISNGTLVLAGGLVPGDLNVDGGTLAAGGAGITGTLGVAGNLNLNVGNVVAVLNKSLTLSNTVYAVTNAITCHGAKLRLYNYGPPLVVGDKFTLFSQPVGGAAMTIVSPGFVVANHLATDGSVTVTTASASAATIMPTVSAGHLTLSWPAIWTGLHLEVQTNSLAGGLGTNWVTVPGTGGVNSYLVTVDPNVTVYYRLGP
jgi:autotransporter-associated beta strand protein